MQRSQKYYGLLPLPWSLSAWSCDAPLTTGHGCVRQEAVCNANEPAIFVLLAALTSPGYSPMGGQPAVYLYIAALQADARYCRISRVCEGHAAGYSVVVAAEGACRRGTSVGAGRRAVGLGPAMRRSRVGLAGAWFPGCGDEQRGRAEVGRRPLARSALSSLGKMNPAKGKSKVTGSSGSAISPGQITAKDGAGMTLISATEIVRRRYA